MAGIDSASGGPAAVSMKFDKATGKELASVDLPGIGMGTPMTYRIGDKQFIAMTVSGKAGELTEIVALAAP